MRRSLAFTALAIFALVACDDTPAQGEQERAATAAQQAEITQAPASTPEPVNAAEAEETPVPEDTDTGETPETPAPAAQAEDEALPEETEDENPEETPAAEDSAEDNAEAEDSAEAETETETGAEGEAEAAAADAPLPDEWTVGKTDLTASCFPFLDSADGAKGRAVQAAYDVSGDALFSPGRYLNELTGGDIDTEACGAYCEDEGTPVLAADPAGCAKRRAGSGDANSYDILARLQPVQCQALAPAFDRACREAYLLALTAPGDEEASGTYSEYTIYGLFDMDGGTQALLPLRRYTTEESALAFIERLN